MGPEHLKGAEIAEAPNVPEHTRKDLESERPGGTELPHIESGENKGKDLTEWKNDDSNREEEELPHIRDVDDGYYSTYDERLKQTPTEESDRGEWSGLRGESDYIPKDEKIKGELGTYGKDRISYKDAMPDFSEVSESTVKIDHMTEDRSENFRQCDEKCAKQWNKDARDGKMDWAAREVKSWRQEHGYTWHERNDMETCDLVHSSINAHFGHLGGVSECRKRDAGNGGSDFDE